MRPRGGAPAGLSLSLLTATEHQEVLPIAGRTVLDVGCGSGLYTTAALSDGAAAVTSHLGRLGRLKRQT